MAVKSPSDSLNKPLSFLVKVSGKVLPSEYAIYDLNVNKEANKLSRARFSIIGGDPYQQKFEESEDTLFKPGQDVEILLGYEQKHKTVFKGIIEKHSLSLSQGYDRNPTKSLLILECVDKSIMLKNAYTNEVFEGKKDSEIISNLLSKAGIDKSIKPTQIVHDFLPKYNVNDWDFILQRVAKNGMLLFNSDNKIEVVVPKSSGSAVLEVVHGKSTIAFSAQVDSSSQLGDSSFLSWDPFTEKKVESRAKEPSIDKYGNLDGPSLASNTSPKKNSIQYPQPIAPSEAKVLGDAEIVKSRLAKLVGKVRVKGVNHVKLGDAIVLRGFGKRFDGQVLVTSIEHHLNAGIYETSIGFGFKEYLPKISHSINVESLVPNIQGLHIGTVTKIDKDPDNQYRIKLQIPSFKLSGEGLWARLSHFYSSKDSGSFFVPEKGTQVVVGFIAQDPRYPIILGSLYTKKNSPYTKIESANDLKAIISREKLTIEFDEKNKMITVQSGDSNRLVISENDASNWRGWKVKKGFTISDSNGNTIITSESGISLESKKDISINAKGIVKITGSKGVELNGPGGSGIKAAGNNVSLKASSKFTAKGGSGADLSAGGSVNIKGASVNIN